MDTTNLLWYSSIAVQFFFCLYLVWSSLGRTYPVFTICLGGSVIRSLAAMYFMRGAVGPRLPLSYTYFWLWSQPFWLLLLIAVAFEVHTKIWKEHVAVLKHTRWLLIFALFLALFFAALPLMSEVHPTPVSRLIAVMHFGIEATQYISSVLAIFLLLSAAVFFLAVRDPLGSNPLRHEGMLAAYFAIYALAAFLIDVGATRAMFINSYVSCVMTFCFVVWITVFRPQEIPGN